MPRRSKGPRLYFRKAKGKRKAVYVIRDSQHEYSTGTVDREQAEAELRIYMIRKHDGGTIVEPSQMTVQQALVLYGNGPAADAADPARIGYAIDALDRWWADLPIIEINEQNCRNYASARGVSPGTVRRELGCLRAAINYALPPGVQKPSIWMPPKPPARDVWLTRPEAARLIRAARRTPETRHLVKFILIGLYTGSRKSVILALKYEKHSAGGWADLDRGLMYRKAPEATETDKKAPPIPITKKLLGHLRRWRKTNKSGWIVEFRGCGVACVKNSWATVKKEAGLPNITRHTLRHTSITWAMQAGIDRFEACGFFGITWETLERVYGHHHPNFLRGASDAVGRGGRRSV